MPPRPTDPIPTPPDTPPSLRLAHLSDIHFGKILHETVVPALVDEVNAGGFDLVVISGDLTQRARVREYTAARAMIDAMRPPVLVIPGNHDVPPWWRPFQRLFDASGPFRRYIGDDTTPSFQKEGLAVFGLNSAYGLTVSGGRIRAHHLDRMQAFFEAQPPDAFKILTVHHHLVRLQDLGPHDTARGAKQALERASAAKVDLILCGHLHQSTVQHIEVDVELGRRLVIASAGTATSSRGRGSNRNVNFYNHVSIWPESFVVDERRFFPERGVFETDRTTAFERTSQPVTAREE